MNAYVTLLSSDNYLEGVLCLALSLRDTQPVYPLYVMVSANLRANTLTSLAELDLPILGIDDTYTVPESALAASEQPNWNYTFDKLAVFELTQFECVVYLDADMMVTANLDHLFAASHPSGVVHYGRLPPYEDFYFPNTGLLVVHPRKGLGRKIFALWPQIAGETATFSDQDLIHRYYGDVFRGAGGEWELPVRYNTCVFMVDRIISAYNLDINFSHPGESTVAVLHFTSPRKPWLMSFGFRLYFFGRKLASGKWNELKVYYHYRSYLRRAHGLMSLSAHIHDSSGKSE